MGFSPGKDWPLIPPTSSNRLAPVLTGLRNPGRRSLEIALTGDLDEAQAEAGWQNQFKKIIRVEPASVQVGA